MRVQESTDATGRKTPLFAAYQAGNAVTRCARTQGSADEVPGGSETVLVVDDDALVLELVGEMVADLGYHVLTAPDGASALQVLGSDETIDLLFTDVVMPNHMNGYELARAALRDHPDLKVLMTSAYPRLVSGSEGNTADFPCIAKPYHRIDLARRLRDTLDAA
jgi:CheY-like chemotaxis protein